MGDSRLGVILGAGRPVRGQLPAALFGVAGHGRILDWLVGALGRASDDVVLVGGYRLPEILQLYPALRVVMNPDWATTGAIGSLLKVDLRGVQQCLVSYSDILYRSALVDALNAHTADVVVAVDTCWRERYDNRSAEDLSVAEVVVLDGGTLSAAYGRGGPGRPERPDAELVGLAKLGPRALAWLGASAGRSDVKAWDLPRLLNALREQGIAVETIDCRGEWAELNAPQDIARFVLGTKAQTLERLRPMVRRSRIGRQVSFTLKEWQSSPATCLADVRQAFGPAMLIVRSSALGEDSFDSSGAGLFLSLLNVDGSTADAVARAIDKVASSYQDGGLGNQVLVQAMLTDIALSGVAVTRTLTCGAPYRVINFDDVSGSSDSVTSGRGERLRTLYMHRDCDTPPSEAPPGMQSLVEALKELEELVGHDSLDVEFIVSSSQEVHVLQLRPIAVNHGHWRGSDELVRDALDAARRSFLALQSASPFVAGRQTVLSVMTDWNPAEIIGTRPRRLAYSLYADLITDRTWALQRREYGYRDTVPQPLMRSVVGHPYIDVRASFNSFVPAEISDALAERLVDNCMSHLLAHPHLHDKVEFEVVFSCLSFEFDHRAQRLLAAGFSRTEVQQLKDALAALTRRAFTRVAGDHASIDRLLVRQAQVRAAGLPPLRSALTLLDDCREHGTLPFAHLARSGFVATALLKSAVLAGVITEADRAAYLQSVTTVATDYRRDFLKWCAGDLTRERFLSRFGHLRPGTYDITAPSYAEDPDRYLDAGGSPGESHVATDPVLSWSPETRTRFVDALAALGLPVDDFGQIDRFMRESIAGRESAKFAFSRSISDALDQFIAFGQEVGISREELSHLTLSDLRACDAGLVAGDVAVVLRARADEGRLAHELTLGVELPPLLRSEHDLMSFLCPEASPNFIGTGSVVAPVACLDGLDSRPASLVGRIVLVSQADPGHDWLFGQGIAGLVTAYGGANSHMAVRAAEFGLPAAIGVGEQRYHQLMSSSRLVLDCRLRRLETFQ